MNITNIQPIVVSQSGNKWTLRVTYTATFTNQEKDPPLNYIFRDCIQIWEEDPFSDDQITGWVASSNFNPSENSVVRRLTTVVDGNDLDTELGGGRNLRKNPASQLYDRWSSNSEKDCRNQSGAIRAIAGLTSTKRGKRERSIR